MKVLVTGGAGYIGSFITPLLLQEGHEVVVVDNLVYGHREAVDVALEVGELGDASFLDAVLARHRPEAVMHLAAWIEVNESVRHPSKYFTNNTAVTVALLDCMVTHGVRNLVFSSTAAVYGSPPELPITEDSLTRPDSPYGLSKLLTELTLPWYSEPHRLRAVTLRYFNAAGAALDGSRGEDHEPATHLITNAVKAALGQQPFTLFGDDYPETVDGTCERDYIHVLDIARAHLLALDALLLDGQTRTYNVGTGSGYTNLEVIESVKRISGVNFPVTVGPRRADDPPRLVADASRLRQTLGWKPQYSDLDTIVASSWKWHTLHPHGYRHDLTGT